MIKNILAVIILLMTGQVLGASLFTSTTVLEPVRLAVTEQAGITADVDVSLLQKQEPSFIVELPGGQTLTAVFKSLRANQQKGYSWQGFVKGDTSQTITLSVYEDAIAGSIHSQQAVYEIQPLGQFRVRVVELNSAEFPECSGAQSVPNQDNLYFLESPLKNKRANEVVDVIVVYTPQARIGAGGHNAIKATAQAAVDAMNSSIDNSLVDTEIVLLYSGEVNYNETTDGSQDLAWAQSSSEVRNLLDTYGADMVSLLVDEMSNGCGIGYVMRNPSPGFRNYAVQVTDKDCAVGNLSFAHEFGHNMGLEHDPANGPSPGNASYPWSFGHFHNNSYRTVMSYSNQCTSGCSRRQYFSNPSVSYLGLATGIDNMRDNARTLDLTSPVTAAFRTRKADGIFANGFEVDDLIFKSGFE